MEMLLSDHDRPTERAPGAKPGNLNLLVLLYIYIYNLYKKKWETYTCNFRSYFMNHPFPPFPTCIGSHRKSMKICEYINQYIYIYHLSPSITIYHLCAILDHHHCPRCPRCLSISLRRWPWTTATTCSRARPAAPARCSSARLPRASCAPRGAAVRRPCRGAAGGRLAGSRGKPWPWWVYPLVI